MRKCAAFILVCMICGIFLNILAAADYEPAPYAGESTHIRSIIPFIEREDGGLIQNVPIESHDDIWAVPPGGSASLRFQIYIGAADAQRFHGQTLYICKLRPFEDISQVSTENTVGSFPANHDEGFTYTVSVLTDLSNLNNGEIFNKFVVAARAGEDLTPISSARYIDNINHLANRRHMRPVSRSKKGLTAIQMPGEARLLGVRHTTVKMLMNDFILAGPAANTHTYMFGGEEFHFNMDVVAEYDRRIKFLTNEGIKVTAVLVLSAQDYIAPQFGADEAEARHDLRPLDHLIHRGARANPRPGAVYFGVNTADEYGFRYFAALMSFIADRYVREDTVNGRIHNIILGSDIGNANMNYSGELDIRQYVRDYLRALRIADAAVRSRFGGARVYVPLDNSFAHSPDGGHINREIIDLLKEYSALEGNFSWNVAVQAFNADRSSLEVWRESLPTDNFDTPFITMRNIGVLVDYLNVEKRYYLPEGERRSVMISGAGFTSGGTSPGGMELQAASFVYAYLRARYIPEITAFIYYRQVDDPRLFGGYFGLRKENGEQKPIHDVFRYMDTSKELEHIEFAKPILGIECFTEIAPLYSGGGFAVMLTEGTGRPNRSSMSVLNIGRFNRSELAGFIGSANMGDISLEDRSGEDSEFGPALFAGFTAPAAGDFGSISRIYEPGSLLDLSGYRFAGINMRIDTGLSFEPEHTVRVVLTLEAEAADALHVYEGIANIRLNEDARVFFDIGEWEPRGNISRVSLAANPFGGAYAAGGGYDFRMYVHSITAANISGINTLRTVIAVGIGIAGAAVALWAALFIRAQVIKARRKKRRLEQQQKRKAARKRAPAGNRPTRPPGNQARRD